MATRSGIPGTKVANDPWSAANVNSLPAGLIGYAQATTNQGSLTAPVADLTSLTLTFTPPASRILRIGYRLLFQDSTAQGTTECVRVIVMKDGANFDQMDFVSNPGAGTNNASVTSFCFDFNPTNASHTYKLQAGRAGTATGTFTLIAAATQPAILAIWDDSPSF